MESDSTPDFDTLALIAADTLKEEHFDFDKWSNCSRCAIGTYCLNHPSDEMKVDIFPGIRSPVPIYRGAFGIVAVAARLKISLNEASNLFVPGYSAPRLGQEATKEEVAANIYKFIREKKQELGIM